MAAAWRVLVTRPEPGASATAALLREMGFEPVLVPLSETRPLDISDEDMKAEAVAVTSAAALRHAPAQLLARMRALPCLAVGERTAEAARAAGFADVLAAAGDAGKLSAMLTESLPPGSHVAYLCGRVRLPDFEATLTAAGFVVATVETYDTISRRIEPDFLRQRLGARPLDAVLCYSAKSAEVLRELVLRDPAPFRRARFLCISPRVAAALGDLAVANVISASEPNEEAITALLLRIADAATTRAFSAQAAMLREETGTPVEIDSTEPGMVKTTRPSRTGRDPVTIELAAGEPTDAPGSGAAATTGGDKVSSELGGPEFGADTATPPVTNEATIAPDVASSGDDALSGSSAVAAGTPGSSAGSSAPSRIGGSDAPAGESPLGSSESISSDSSERSSSPFGPTGSGQPASSGSPARDASAEQAATTVPPARRAYRGTAFLAGLTGGLMVLVLAGALQFAGLLPSPATGSAPAAVPEVVQAELAALRQDVAELATLRQEVARLEENGAAPPEAIQGLTASVEEIRTELAALRESPGGAAPDLGPLDARLTLLEQAVADLPKQDAQALTALGERVAAAEALVKSSGETLAASETRLAALEQTLPGLDQTLRGLTAKVDAQANQPQIARSIAASALKAAIDRGAPFRAELETLAAIVPPSPDLTALQGHAEKGVATEAQIAAEWPAVASAMIAADQPPDQNAGFFDRLLDSAQSMVEVRPIGAVPGSGVPETVARMEVAVNSGDLAGALAEYETLPAPAKAAGAGLAEKIRARVEAVRLADQAIAAAMAAG